MSTMHINLLKPAKARLSDLMQSMYRRAMPRYVHFSGVKQKWKIEYWPGNDCYRNSLHFTWNWMGRGHWFCIFLPELS